MIHQPEYLTADEQDGYLRPLCQHFAMDEAVFARYALVRMAKRSLYLFPQGLALWQPQPGLSIEGLGIRFLRTQHMAIAKPTFEACAWMLPHVKAHLLVLDRDSAQRVRQGLTFAVNDALRAQLPSGRALLLCHWQGISFGCVHWNGEQLKSFFPKRYGHVDALWPAIR